MSRSDSNGIKKKRSFGLVRMIILIVSAAVFCYSGYRLYKILNGYRQSDKEYDEIADTFTKPYENEEPEETAASEGPLREEDAASSSVEQPADDEEEEPVFIEDAVPPLNVDWKELHDINPDIVGWLYIDALPDISYPICQSSDNDFYLHRTFRQQYLFAGSIFEDYHNNDDFADPNTIVYGHNMRNGSMFGTLKYLKDPAKYEASPYFWILTPDGNYRYHIFSIQTTDVNSDVYVLFSQNGSEFLSWEEHMASLSEASFDVPLSKNDKTVILSTCTSDSTKRNVVIGKCVSSDRPLRMEEKIVDPTEYLLAGAQLSLDVAVEAMAGVEIPNEYEDDTAEEIFDPDAEYIYEDEEVYE